MILIIVKAKNGELRTKRAQVESEVIAKRDTVASLKQSRDTLRTENFDLKQKSGLIGSDDLLRDFEKRKVIIQQFAQLTICRMNLQPLPKDWHHYKLLMNQ